MKRLGGLPDGALLISQQLWEEGSQHGFYPHSADRKTEVKPVAYGHLAKEDPDLLASSPGFYPGTYDTRWQRFLSGFSGLGREVKEA